MDNNIDILDDSKYFMISGNVVNVRQREYNGNITKYVMIEDLTNAQYPNYFEVEFYKDKAELVANVKEGDFITCNINFGGRKWEDKETGEVKGSFFSLKGWKVQIANEIHQYAQGQHPQYHPPVNQPSTHTESMAQAQAQVPTMPNIDDDEIEPLPF